MADKFKKGDGPAHSVKAKAVETRHLTPFGVKLAEELNDWYNKEHTLHAPQCVVALVDIYRCLGGLAAWCTYSGWSMPSLL